MISEERSLTDVPDNIFLFPSNHLLYLHENKNKNKQTNKQKKPTKKKPTKETQPGELLEGLRRSFIGVRGTEAERSL